MTLILIDLQLHLGIQKTGNQNVHLSQQVLDVLRAEKTRGSFSVNMSFLVWMEKSLQILESLGKSCEECWIRKRCCVHSLRHTAASHLAMRCFILEIAHILGHKSLSMVKRYSHLSTHVL